MIEDGPHDRLLASGGRYATLWRLQTAGVADMAPSMGMA